MKKTEFWVTISALFVGFLFQAVAFGQSEGLPVSWAYQITDENLVFTFEAFDNMDDVDVTISSGRNEDESHVRRIRTGETWTVELDIPSATSTFEVRVEATHAEERGFTLDRFDLEVFGAFSFSFNTDEFNAEATSQRMHVTMNQPAGQVSIVVRSDDGRTLAERTIQYDGEPAGTPLLVNWTRGAGRILAIDVRAESTNGSWSSTRLTPWSLQEQFDDLNFASNSAEIAQVDRAPLAEYARNFQQTAENVSEYVEAQLYVAGYTDTVGSSSDNRRLSEERAESIARFMRSSGFAYPIFYQGFGEDALAVPTDDNVDNAQNRRAVFVMGPQEPPHDATFPSSRWRELR